jgi:hypothetical protein
MKRVRNGVAALLLLATANPAFSQTSEQSPADAPATVRIPAGTIVQVEFTERLSSEQSQRDQAFGLRLLEPIIVDGREVVHAGATGGGEVLDAVPAGAGGRQGRLIVAGRFLDLNGMRVRIRGMQVMLAGEHRGEAAIVQQMTSAMSAGSADPMRGGNVHIEPGARATAIIAADTDVSGGS